MLFRSHPDYIFVTKIPRMLILYFTFLKNDDNSSSNDVVVIESALYVFFLFCLNVSYCFWQIVVLIFTKNKRLLIFVPWPIVVPFTLHLYQVLIYHNLLIIFTVLEFLLFIFIPSPNLRLRIHLNCSFTQHFLQFDINLKSIRWLDLNNFQND